MIVGWIGRMNQLESKWEAEEKDEKSFTKALSSHHGCNKAIHGSKLELLANDQGAIVDEADILVVSIPDSDFDLPLFFFLSVDPDFQGTARTLLSEINYNWCTRGTYHGDNSFLLFFPRSSFHIYQPKGSRPRPISLLPV